MSGIKHFFSSIGAFLTKAQEYLETRVPNGKYIEDIRFINALVQRTFVKSVKTGVSIFFAFPLVKLLKKLFLIIWHELLQMKAFALIVSLIAQTVKILITFYTEIFVVFAITFPTTILLLNFFQNSIIVFLIALIPILLFITYCISALLYCINERQKGVTISIWESFQKLLPSFFSLNIVPLYHGSLIVISGVIYFILSLFTSYLFQLLGITSGDNFFYWFIVIFLGFLFIIFSFVTTVAMHQAYLSVLLDNMPTAKALYHGWKQLKKNSGYLFFVYLLLYLFFIALLWRSAISYLHLGITITTYFLINASVFLGFIYRKNPIALHSLAKDQINSPQISQEKQPHKVHIYPFIIMLGFVNFILLSVVVVQEYRTVSTFVKRQQEHVLLTQEQTRYTNSPYRYTFEYPQSWVIYERSDGTVTFYHNYTGTLTGAVWLNISIAPYSDEFFQQLYRHNPGVIAINNQTQDVTAKIANISIQGHEGVAYAQTTEGERYREYHTHYLIHKGDVVYDIVFTTLANDVGGYNNELFDRIVSSFRFIE